MHCLEKSRDLLTNRNAYIGLVDPDILLATGYKLVLRNMTEWNNFIGYPFFHTYSPDGNVSIDLYPLYHSLEPIFVIRSLAGSATSDI